MTAARAVFDASPWRRLFSLLVLLVVAGGAALILGLPVPTTAAGWLPVAAVALVGAVAWAWVLPAVVRSFPVRLGILGVFGLAAGWYLVSPLFINRVVDEDLPEGSSSVVSATTTDEPDSDAQTSATPASPSAAQPPSDAPREAPATDAAPVRIAGGTLTGIDHRATGGVGLYRLADGSWVVRLEEVDMENGPDLFVHLVPEAGQADPAGGVNLGRLKGNQGNQNYPVPDSVQVDDYATVLIWCRAFSTPFANATLTSA